MSTTFTYAICSNCKTPIQLVDDNGPHASWRHTLGLAERDWCQEVKAPAGYKCCGNCKEHCVRAPSPTVTDNIGGVIGVTDGVEWDGF